MSKSLSIKTLIWSLAVTILFMGLMLFYSANKMVVIADSASKYVTSDEEGELLNVEVMTLSQKEGIPNSFTIQVPTDVVAESIIVENQILDREIWLYFDRTKASDFGDYTIEGDVSDVLSAYLQEVRGGVWIKLQMRGLYECVTTLENGELTVTTGKPAEIYGKIVVLDCVENGLSKDISIKLSKLLDENQIKVYNLSESKDKMSLDQKIEIANDAEADMYIKIQTDTDLNPDYYGVDSYYNEEFFTPMLDGATLADAIERNLVFNVYTTGHLPIGDASSYEELSKANIPAIVLTVGYTSNAEENLLLNKDSYRRRVAEGIYNGICEVYAGRDY